MWSKTATHEDTKGASRKPKKSLYPLNTLVNTMFQKKKQNRFQLSFNSKEVPVYMPMEEFLMEDLDIPTRSDTYKIALKNLYRQRKQAHLEIAWDK